MEMGSNYMYPAIIDNSGQGFVMLHGVSCFMYQINIRTGFKI